MAYSSAIFYINLTSGSDAARTALTSCVASNPSGSTVRINKTGHGLVTGAIVDLTLFDTYLNDAWKITVVDADNFDLDTAVWSIATVDTNGTVTPRGGSSWTDGWRTITSGPTAARTQLGDTIRINKTDDPTSLGNGTWTNLSKTVTLATEPSLKIIDLCETAFTAANASTVGTDADRKQGTVSCTVNKGASTTTNTLYAYRAISPALNLSAYDAITLFYSSQTTSAILAGNWKICLCSDPAGATPVDTFELPATVSGCSSASSPTSAGGFRPIVLTRTGGGALGSSIQSIAIYSSTVAPTAGTAGGIAVDNILACVNGGLTLQSLISKNSSAFGGTEVWHTIQTISASTVTLDAYSYAAATVGRGYYGASETVTTYYRNTFAQGPYVSSVSTANVINEGGTTAFPITYSGGWNTASNTQDGETILDGVNSYGQGIYISNMSNLIFERLSLVRFYDGYYVVGTSTDNIFTIPNLVGCSNFGYYDTPGRNIVNITNACANAGGILPGLSNKINVQKLEGNIISGIQLTSINFNNVVSASSISNNGSYGVENTGACNNNKIIAGSISNNGTAAVRNVSGDMYLFNTTLGGTEFAGATAGYDSRVFSTNHDLSGYAYIYTDGGIIDQIATTFTGGSGAEWRLSVNNTTRDSYYPLKLPVAQYAVASGSLLIVSASMKKSHATDVRGKLVIPGGQLLGVPNDVVATLADNTNEQGLTVSCTPTMSGVLGVEVWAEYVNNTGTVSVDTVTARI